MSIQEIQDKWESVRELCERYELPPNLAAALRVEARNYEEQTRSVQESLNSLQRTIASALDSADRNCSFWNESRFISQKAADIYEKSAAIQVIVNTVCVLIGLCAQEVLFNTVLNCDERSGQFETEARMAIFGEMK